MAEKSNTIRVNIKGSEPLWYDIEIGTNLFGKLAKELKEKELAYSYAVVTDTNVSKLYFKKLEEAFNDEGLSCLHITIPAGEQSKNRHSKEFIEDTMLKNSMARDSAIVALGGGVVGDIAGFVAATYTRGIPYVQYPTSLVACVDSSIGGKTAVDTPYGKNLIGSFYQPVKVYIDLETLKTLNEQEIREGLAEVIKYGIIYDREFFYYIKENIEGVFAYDLDVLGHVVRRSCEIKGHVVEKDEKESNLRKILNFGHTIGHAVEQLSDYTISHGNAISIGMVMEAQIAHDAKILDGKSKDMIEEILSLAGLPTKMPSSIDRYKIRDTMKLDKKARRG
ncbi:MAG: 3-dehydroquinate synthase, partial [Candidatus Dadabacteria bacterium]|nr:3-dehydroquinate synthase [Candidatus Dadabacteria bacterium]